MNGMKEMTDKEAAEVLRQIRDTGVFHMGRGNMKSLRTLRFVEALTRGINKLEEDEDNDNK